MDSARFRYSRQDEGGGAEEELGLELEEVPCFLDIYVHAARNIHSTCVSANQDVYAKLALTSAPDHAPALCTRVAAQGASPSFEERLAPLRVRRGRLAVDVLKCEVWMRGRVNHDTLMRPEDDRLLGFALVPLAAVAAADGARLSRDFELSSTDLFRSPAGTIRLSLGLHSGLPGDACPPPPERNDAEPSITSEVVIFEPAPHVVDDDHSRIQSPDLINVVVKESHDDMMAVQYLPFLQLGEARPPEATPVDCEMSTSPRGDAEKPAASSLDDGSKNDASTTTTASDDRLLNSSTSAKAATTEEPVSTSRSPETPTSSNNNGKKKTGRDDEKGDVLFTSPLEGIDVDAEQIGEVEMQRQIMEMYVRSMQQFSESLAKMQMPVELAGGDGGGIVVVQKEMKKPAAENQQQQRVKNDGAARVFYGSRAFF